MLNEIETLAILDSVRFIHLPPDRRTEICDALKTAMQALREKQEREKGCAVCSCEYHQELCAEVVRYHSSDFATQEKVDVHYCPVCGRRLEVEHER
ncbi:MAG: hypothetical protein WDA65_02790 [Christensenellales bacterium]